MTHTAPQSAAAATPPVPGAAMQLNTFQRLMRRWNQLWPYSAAQVMLVRGPADSDRWRAASADTLTEAGLGRPRIDPGDRWVRFAPSGPLQVEVVTDTLDAHLSAELNRPFAPDDLPIRFFLLEHGAGSHWFGAVYDHWIADSRAMRELMERIYARYVGHGTALPAPLRLSDKPFSRLYRKYIGRLPRCIGAIMSSLNMIRHARAFRINLADPMDFHAQVRYQPLPDGLIERVHVYARAHGSSVNDCFLAALGQTLGTWTAEERGRKRQRRFHYRRDRVGLGTIVDIRDSASESLDDVLGLYLSWYTLVLDKPEQRDLLVLLSEIAGCTRRIKRNHTAVKECTALLTAQFWWDFFWHDRHRAMMFHKHVPIAAGISNVNMTGSWVDQRPEKAPDQPAVLDYLRISPTGPLLPLVFTLTTIRGRLSLCTTYRVTAFDEAQVQRLMADFLSRLTHLVDSEV